MKPRKFGCHVIYSASVRPYVRSYVRPYRNCIARAWVYVRPVGPTQGTRVRKLIYLNAHQYKCASWCGLTWLTRSNAHVRVYLQSVGSMWSNMHVRPDMQPNTHARVDVGLTRSNAHALVYLHSCEVMRVREQICNPRAQLREMRVREWIRI